MSDDESLKKLIYSIDVDDKPNVTKRRRKATDENVSDAVKYQLLDLSQFENLSDPTDMTRIAKKVHEHIRGIRTTPTASAWCAVMMPDAKAVLAREAGKSNKGKKKTTRSKVVKARDSIKEAADYLLQNDTKTRNLVSKILEIRPAFSESQVRRRLNELGYLPSRKK